MRPIDAQTFAAVLLVSGYLIGVFLVVTAD